MDEGRKRVLLVAATILAGPKLAKYDKPCPAVESAIADALVMAERIMSKIDTKYPVKPSSSGGPGNPSSPSKSSALTRPPAAAEPYDY
jgi:hypothetical protein